MKFLITDWISNVCFDTENMDLPDFDTASEYLDRMVEHELSQDGLNPYGEFADCKEGYTADATDEDFEEYRGEYTIEEYREFIDRIMWTGTRYVLKQNYYK